MSGGAAGAGVVSGMLALERGGGVEKGGREGDGGGGILLRWCRWSAICRRLGLWRARVVSGGVCQLRWFWGGLRGERKLVGGRGEDKK